MEIISLSVSDLSNDPANARKHNDRNIEAIIASLRRFGQQKPIVIDKSNVVRAGNGTLEAARRLGWDKIDCVVTNLESSDATAYAIADNRTAELAEWDSEILAAELESLQSDGLLEAAGFTDEELAEMLQANQPEPEIAEDEVPEPPADPITKPGDLWLLGDHRLLCGDSTKAEDVERLMAGAKADLCFTSPPYGQQRDYTEEGKAKVADWDGLMRGVFGILPMTDAGQVLVNLGMIHRDGEWIPYWDSWIEWMRQQGWRRFGWYVWDQGSGLPGDWGGRFAPSHEFVFHFNKQSVRPEKYVEKIDDNVRHAKANYTALRKKDGSIGKLSSPEASLQTHKIPDSVVRAYRSGRVDIGHPATFSVGFAGCGLQSWLGLVYEPFMGSGTTLIAAEQLGRKCYGMEISPAYCDVIVKRWETLTGRQATREGAK